MDIKKFFHLILAFSLIEMLVGCSPQPMTSSFITTDSAPEPSIDRNTQAKLAETASSVDLSLKELSESYKKAPATIWEHLHNLENAGRIRIYENKPRGIEILK